MSARTFGTTDGKAEFAAKYGSDDYAAVGESIRQADFAAKYREVCEGFSAPSAILPATPKAVKFLVDLWMERSDKATREQVQAWAEQQDRQVVSDKIEWLLAQPKLTGGRSKIADYGQVAAQVPAGRYAVESDAGRLTFVHVDKPTEGQYKGRTFVSVRAGDEEHKAYGPQGLGLLRKILADGPKAASIRYGKELGVCGHCGRTLTDEASRAAGIGPVCASKF